MSGGKGLAVKFATKRASIDVDVQLPSSTFVEGSAISATARSIPTRDLTVLAGEVELIRTVTCCYRAVNIRGDKYTVHTRTSDVVGRHELPSAGRLTAGQPLIQHITLVVPADGPGSATTKLVQIEWAVRVHLQVEGIPDVEATQPIVVLSSAHECVSAARAPSVAVDRGCAVLGFDSLSSRRLVPGTQLSGVLTVAPLHPGAAGGVRVELVLVEQVHPCPGLGDEPAALACDHEEEAVETVVASVQLGRRLEFDPTRVRRFPFTLPVPPKVQAPSVQTAEFSLRWILRGVLERPRQHNPHTDVELHGVTTRP
jgi:hypothetical protein